MSQPLPWLLQPYPTKAKNVPSPTGQEQGFMFVLIRSSDVHSPLKVPLAQQTLSVTFTGKQDKNCALLLLGCNVNILPLCNIKPTYADLPQIPDTHPTL